MVNDRFEKYDVIISGAGPAGLAAAIESSRRGLSCLLADKNKKPGRKLYAAGNGHANICNAFYDKSCYYDSEFMEQILADVDLTEFVTDYFDELGVNTVSKNGYYYPMSMQASSIVWALRDAAVMSGAEIKCDAEIIRVEETNNEYLVHFKDGSCKRADAFILATGSPSSPELGAADEKVVYELLDSLKLEYEPYRASLGPVRCDESFELISGVRCDAEIKVGDSGISERGELQITESTLSGIVVFNLSDHIRKMYEQSGNAVLTINVIPDVNETVFRQKFSRMIVDFPERRFTAFLNGFINDKLAVYFILKMMDQGLIFDDKTLMKDVNIFNVNEIYRMLTEWKVNISGLYGFNRSQASSGGVKTSQIDPADMHIIGRRELYAAGEATEVLGKCGGYNISFALYSGYLAGRSCLNGGFK